MRVVLGPGLDERLVKRTQVQEELSTLEKDLAAREARLRKMQGGIKATMLAASVVRAFQLTPDDAAAKIQAHYRGKTDRKLVDDKKSTKVETVL